MIGTSSGQISIIISGKKFGTDKLLNIIAALPDLHSDWLLTRQGQMENGGKTLGVHQTDNFNVVGNKNKQKNISGTHQPTTSVDNSNVIELQHKLQLGENEKRHLEQRLQDKEALIEVLKESKKPFKIRINGY